MEQSQETKEPVEQNQNQESVEQSPSQDDNTILIAILVVVFVVVIALIVGFIFYFKYKSDKRKRDFDELTRKNNNAIHPQKEQKEPIETVVVGTASPVMFPPPMTGSPVEYYPVVEAPTPQK